MTRFSSALGFFTVFALASACSVTPLMDANDELSGGPGSSNVVGSACAGCFDACGWETTQCAGDPNCARWLSCAQSCGVTDPAGFPNNACVTQCGTVDTKSGDILRRDLLACIAPSCCDVEGSVPPTAIDAGGVPGNGGEGGGSSVGGAGGEVLRTDFCADCECIQCLEEVKEAEGLEDGCAMATQACFESHVCKDKIMSTLAGCAGERHSVYACLYPDGFFNNTMSGEIAEGLTLFLSTVFGCMVDYCAAACIPEGERDCVTCQVSECRTQMASLLDDFDAQRLYQCILECNENSADPDCKPNCAAAHPAGVYVFQDIAQCMEQNCSTECGG